MNPDRIRKREKKKDKCLAIQRKIKRFRFIVGDKICKNTKTTDCQLPTSASFKTSPLARIPEQNQHEWRRKKKPSGNLSGFGISRPIKHLDTSLYMHINIY